jgi:hypothetical protein
MTTADRDRYPLRPTHRQGTPAMRTYRALVVSGPLAALALGATMIAQGDWQSALGALAGLSGGAFLLTLTRLLAIGERPAAVAEPRREAAPPPGAPPRPATTRIRPTIPVGLREPFGARHRRA